MAVSTGVNLQARGMGHGCQVIVVIVLEAGAGDNRVGEQAGDQLRDLFPIK